MHSMSNMPIVDDNVVKSETGPVNSISATFFNDEQKPQEDEQKLEEGNRNLLVTGLSRSMVETELMELFRPFGTVTRVKVTRDVHTGKSRGQGFVLFKQLHSAVAAVKALNGKRSQFSGGETLHVYYSRCKPSDAPALPSKTLFVRNVPKDTPLAALQYYFTQFGGIIHHCTKHEDKAVGQNGLSIVVRLKFDKKAKAQVVLEHIQKMTANPFSVYHKAPGSAPLLIARFAQVFTEQERQSYREKIAAKRASDPPPAYTPIGSGGCGTPSPDDSRGVAPTTTTTTGILIPPVPVALHPPPPPVNPPPPPPQLITVLPLIPVPQRSTADVHRCLPLPPPATTVITAADGSGPVAAPVSNMNVVLPYPSAAVIYCLPQVCVGTETKLK